jgi:hypothetical protein
MCFHYYRCCRCAKESTDGASRGHPLFSWLPLLFFLSFPNRSAARSGGHSPSPTPTAARSRRTTRLGQLRLITAPGGPESTG